MLTDKMLANLKTEIFCADKMDGIDGSALIPVQLGGTLDLSKPPAYSIMDLGKMLLMSAKEGDTSKVHDLMSRGAPFTTDWLGTSPLHLASMNNHLQTCEVLIRAGMSKDARTKVDRTPLHFAVYEGHEEIVELLLFNKCDIEAKDMLKMTPLHWAVEKHHTKIVEMLLQQGADPSACSKFKKTPLSIAAENGYDDIFQLLEAAFRLRLENPDQVKTATDNLVQELEQQQQQQNVMHLESLDCDTFELESQSEENDNTTHKEDNFSQQIDSDEGMTLSDAIIHLQNVDDSKPMDTSALQILKDHGISMLPAEDTENTLITSALESGRKIVLSEGGKLVLNETKPKKVAVPIIQPATQQPLKVVKKQPITVPAKTLPWKSNKVIKIITAEEFKQICCGDITTLKKISPDYLNQNIMPVKLNSFKSSNVTVPSYKPRKTIPIRNKLGLPSSISITPENKPKQQTTFINLASDTEAYESDLEMSPHIQTFQIATSSIASPSTSTFSSPSAVLQNHLPLQSTGTTTVRTVVTNSASPVQQTTTMGLSEIERQLLELKKQTDELRKQLELSQKQNEEYKLRLEKLEKEKEVEKEERNRRMSLPL